MCDCEDYNGYGGFRDDSIKQSSYYIETSGGRISFVSKNVEHIRIQSRKVDEYINFIPTNNTKFLKFADKYCTQSMNSTFNIYSEKTKNGAFLKLSTYHYTVEYKIFKV